MWVVWVMWIGCRPPSSPSTETGTPTDSGAPTVYTIVLPGDRLFPEGIAAAGDGTLYIGSLETGAIVTAAPGEEVATTWLGAGAFEPLGIMGLEVEDAAGLLWFCTSEFGEASALVAWDRATVAEVHRFALPAGGFCNDLAIGPDRSVYATDSFGGVVWRVPPDRATLEPWGVDPNPAPAGQLGLNGVAVLDGTVWALRFDFGGMVGWPIAADGSASPPVPVSFDGEVGSPDGLDLHGDRLIAVDGRGDRLVALTVDGEVTPIAGELSTPTTLAVVGDDAWVVEGQLGERGGAPSLPFVAVRVPLPSP